MKCTDTYCPHCWAQIKTCDTTCRSCGNAVIPHNDVDSEDSVERAQMIGEMYAVAVVIAACLSLVVVALL
jgi:predicted amidophosphoribosyltransferase